MAYIVIAGGEGAGKGSVIEHLKGKLSFFAVAEPKSGSIATKLREIILANPHGPMTNAYMFAAARADMFETYQREFQEENVLSDRSFVCSLVYQGYVNGGVEGMKKIWDINAPVVKIPDCIIFLELPWEASQRRLSARAADGGEITHFDLQDREFYDKVQDGYKLVPSFLKSVGVNTEFITVDASKSLEEVTANVEEILKSRGF